MKKKLRERERGRERGGGGGERMESLAETAVFRRRRKRKSRHVSSELGGWQLVTRS